MTFASFHTGDRRTIQVYTDKDTAQISIWTPLTNGVTGKATSNLPKDPKERLRLVEAILDRDIADVVYVDELPEPGNRVEVGDGYVRRWHMQILADERASDSDLDERVEKLARRLHQDELVSLYNWDEQMPEKERQYFLAQARSAIKFLSDEEIINNNDREEDE